LCGVFIQPRSNLFYQEFLKNGGFVPPRRRAAKRHCLAEKLPFPLEEKIGRAQNQKMLRQFFCLDPHSIARGGGASLQLGRGGMRGFERENSTAPSLLEFWGGLLLNFSGYCIMKLVEH